MNNTLNIGSRALFGLIVLIILAAPAVMHAADGGPADEENVQRQLAGEHQAQQDKCPVCHEENMGAGIAGNALVKLACRHELCGQCFLDIARAGVAGPKCPLCRADFTVPAFRNNALIFELRLQYTRERYRFGLKMLNLLTNVAFLVDLGKKYNSSPIKTYLLSYLALAIRLVGGFILIVIEENNIPGSFFFNYCSLVKRLMEGTLIVALCENMRKLISEEQDRDGRAFSAVAIMGSTGALVVELCDSVKKMKNIRSRLVGLGA